MKKKARVVFSVIMMCSFILYPLIGEAQGDKQEIRTLFRDYFSALRAGDAAKAYSMLCEVDKNRRSQKEFFNKGLLGEKYYILRMVDLKISEVVIEGDNAIVDYTLVFPDLNELAEKMAADPDLIPLMLTAMVTGSDRIFKEVADMTQSMLAKTERIEVNKKALAVKEGGKWRVRENFAKQDYASNINIKVNVQKSPPTATIEVANKGKRNIKDVEVAIYLLDSKGTKIKETRCNSPEGVKLKGGGTGSYSCKMKGSPPSKWSGKVEYEFKDFKFGFEE